MTAKNFLSRFAVASMLIGSLTFMASADNIVHADSTDDYLIESYTEDINRNPKDAKAYFNRGLIYSSVKMYDDAIKDFSQVISLDPRKPNAYLHRGIAYRESQKYSQAIADFNKALELKPNDALIINNRAVTYYMMKDYDRAIADYNKVIQAVQPDTPSETEVMLAKQGFKIDINPHSKAWAHYGLGQIHFDTKDYNRAIEDYTNALNNFRHSWFYRERSKCYKAVGDDAKARADLKQYKALDREETRSLEELEDSLYEAIEKTM